MTAVNHALTGMAIGLIIGRPELALPLALASHFVCDALPHFGAAEPEQAIRSRTFRNYLIIETILCTLLVAALAVLRPDHWLLAAVCAFVAASPDLLSIRRYLLAIRDKPWHPGRYARFARRIQWFERPVGAAVEVAWLAAIIWLIKPFLSLR